MKKNLASIIFMLSDGGGGGWRLFNNVIRGIGDVALLTETIFYFNNSSKTEDTILIINLKYPDCTKPFIPDTNGSVFGIDGVLSQLDQSGYQ